MEALNEALVAYGKPDIFNTDQGVQYTSDNFTGILEQNKIAISMDGKGRALDNVFIERFWRSLKQEKIYRLDLETVKDARIAIEEYINFYNNHRLHQSLGYKTPKMVQFGLDMKKPIDMMDNARELPTYQQVKQLEVFWV